MFCYFFGKNKQNCREGRNKMFEKFENNDKLWKSKWMENNKKQTTVILDKSNLEFNISQELVFC